ncbi:MAG: glycoside hydrolase family 88 protein, partial [Clostridia bacterium]|nr:glycoside hydrolase family 88 protein [Clostridia bacterium]
EEASATAGIIAGIKQAVILGIIEEDYLGIYEKGLDYILSVISQKGEVNEVSFGTPVLKSAEEYKNIICVPTLYGQGLAAIAIALA